MEKLNALSTSLEERAETMLTKKARKRFLSCVYPECCISPTCLKKS